MRGLLAIGLSCLLSFAAQATHIIGGELYYDNIGGDLYDVTLKIYRDCGPNNTNGTGFDPSVEIGVFDANGAYLFSEFFTFPGSTTVPVVLNNPCLVAPPVICVEEAEYTGQLTLPSGTGGYILAYQRCCRTPSILNLQNPGSQGLTCMAQVPDASITGPNSSPRFTLYPPIALCANMAMTFDHSATDPDGDQLEYALAEPYDGGSTTIPQPSPPAPPPYGPVTWAPGYSVANMINASPALAIDAVSGFMQLTPTLIGSFVMGVRVTERRNGQVLSEVTRDLRFDVVNCQVSTASAIQQQATFCNGLTVDFVNLGVGGSFHWDMGVPGTLADTSDQVSPTFTYPDSGVYTVTLIADPGWPCADTSTATFAVYEPITVTFNAPPVLCMDAQPMPLTASGPFSATANVAWDTGPLGIAPVLNAQQLLVTFSQPGDHVVQVDAEENGCTATFSDTVTVHPLPVAAFTADTAGCAPYPAQFTDQSTAWTPLAHLWQFGDGTTSTAQSPLHTYTQAGRYDVSLTVTTSTGCVDTAVVVRPQLVQVWPLPEAVLWAEPMETSIMDPTVTINDASVNALAWSFALDGTTYEQPGFVHTFSGAGAFPVELTVTSGPGCTATSSITVIVRDHLFYAPNSFTPDGDGVNDSWRPSVLGARTYELSVFDRWGAVVFSTTDPEAAWDGIGASQGTYAYKVRLAEYGPLDREYNGSVTLLR
ncbi:MAG: PKD domain-containing protein [Flavobacteriales bacterium]|nr:PKD domain-containing protein [Flavobacteriales bacterium]